MRNQKRPRLKMRVASLEKYLRKVFGEGTKLVSVGEIGSPDTQGMKEFGYGKPLEIVYEISGEIKKCVLSVMRGDKYGHQFYWDRAQVLLFQYETSPLMEHHVKPLALGYVDTLDEIIPLPHPKEFFIVNEKVEGYDYFRDLERIRKGGFRKEDLKMARKFAVFLSRLHKHRKDDPDLYLRRIRDLIGSSECIFGIVDAYPSNYSFFPEENFVAMEKRIIEWRWKLRGYTHRLCAVHGDFHPWNVIVRPDGSYTLLDRSRGEWGEPADDTATMTCNYLLFGLYDHPELSGHFAELYLAFWEEYLEHSHDLEMMEVIAPFYVFRALVIASPEWYPHHPEAVRKGLFRFMENILTEDRFDFRDINRYMR